MRANLTGLTSAIKDIVSYGLLNPVEGVLTSAPAWLVIGAIVGRSRGSSRGSVRRASRRPAWSCSPRLSLWEHSMQTLTTVLVATALTLAIGIVFGILSARSDRVRSAMRPFLDMAQTIPAFVYLIPAVALFGPTRFTAIVASIIYATPAVIRLVDAGIREVSPTIVEAATAAGSTERQLLWKVQLPLSRHALLLAANQGIVFVLAMVVLGALVGAGALGYDVIAGFAQREDFGKGLAAGIAIVLLGIMLDRITQGVGGRRPSDVAEGPTRDMGPADLWNDTRQRVAAWRPARSLRRRKDGDRPTRRSSKDETNRNDAAARRVRGRGPRARGVLWRKRWRVAAGSRQGHREDRHQRVGRRGGERRGREEPARDASAIRSRRPRWPRRSPGRASIPVKSTSSSRTGVTRISRSSTSRTRRSPRTPGANGVTGIIGWYVPEWMVTEYPDITNWENLNRYASMFKTSESGDKGQFLASDPTFVTNDEALIANLSLDYKAVYSGSESASVTAFQQAAADKKPLIGYFYTPQWLLAETKLVKVDFPAYTDGCDADPKKVACDYPPYTLNKAIRSKFAADNADAATVVKNFSWSNDDQNTSPTTSPTRG